MKSEALFATSAIPRKTPDDVHADFGRRFRNWAFRPSRRQIKVTAIGDNQGSVVIMAVDYSVPVDLIVYQFTLDFHSHAESHSHLELILTTLATLLSQSRQPVATQPCGHGMRLIT